VRFLDALINWVSQIIMFILLATIIDLLIPQAAMKKYIKLVVGLILILIILKPVFSLFQIDMEKAMESAFREVQLETEAHHDIENLIDLEKNDIENTQHAYILEQMAVQLKEIAEDPLREEFQSEIINMQFQFKEKGEVNFENLEEVIVYISEADGREGDVSEIKEVVIDTKKTIEEKQPEAEDAEPIQELLQEVWELEDKKLTIIREGGTS